MSGLEGLLKSGSNFIKDISNRSKYFLFGSFLLGLLGLFYDNAKAQSSSNAIISGNVKEVVSDSALADKLVYLKDLNDNIICIDTTDINGDYSLNCSITGIEEDKPDKNRFNFVNRGNIFSNSTGFLVSVEEPIELDLKIYDLLGREVGSLAEDKVLSSGNNYSFTWNPNNISSGIYFYRAVITDINSNNEKTRTGKLTYFKDGVDNNVLNVVNPEKFDNRTNISSSSLADYDFTVTDSLTNFYNFIEQINLVDGDNLNKNIEMIAIDYDTLNNVTFLQAFKGLTATVDTVPWDPIGVADWRAVDIPISTNLDSVNAPDSFDIYADSGLTSWENLTGRDWFNVIYCCSLPDTFGIDVKYDSLDSGIAGTWGRDKWGWEGSCDYAIHGLITVDTLVFSNLVVQLVTTHESGHAFGLDHPNIWVSGDNFFNDYIMRYGAFILYPHQFEGKALQILYGFDNRCTNMGPYRDDWTAWTSSAKKEEDYRTTTSIDGCKVNYIYKEED